MSIFLNSITTTIVAWLALAASVALAAPTGTYHLKSSKASGLKIVLAISANGMSLNGIPCSGVSITDTQAKGACKTSGGRCGTTTLFVTAKFDGSGYSRGSISGQCSGGTLNASMRLK